jgi:hypothetical protein
VKNRLVAITAGHVTACRSKVSVTLHRNACLLGVSVLDNVSTLISGARNPLTVPRFCTRCNACCVRDSMVHKGLTRTPQNLAFAVCCEGQLANHWLQLQHLPHWGLKHPAKPLLNLRQRPGRSANFQVHRLSLVVHHCWEHIHPPAQHTIATTLRHDQQENSASVFGMLHPSCRAHRC